MHNLLVFLATTEPSPGEDLREGLDPELVTPGTLGFLATLFVVIATVFLIRDMTKRVRRVRYRQQVQSQDDDGGVVPDNRGPGGGGSDEGADDDGVAPGPGGTSDDGENDGGARSAGTRSAGTRGADGATSSLERDNGTDPDRKG